jgi:hypothetical protein
MAASVCTTTLDGGAFFDVVPSIFDYRPGPAGLTIDCRAKLLMTERHTHFMSEFEEPSLPAD